MSSTPVLSESATPTASATRTPGSGGGNLVTIDISSGKVYPNPFDLSRDNFVVIDQVPPTDTAVVRIYSLSSKLLRSLTKPEGFIDADGKARWDGRTQGGERVPSGIYFYLVMDKGQSRSGKLTVTGGR